MIDYLFDRALSCRTRAGRAAAVGLSGLGMGAAAMLLLFPWLLLFGAAPSAAWVATVGGSIGGGLGLGVSLAAITWKDAP